MKGSESMGFIRRWLQLGDKEEILRDSRGRLFDSDSPYTLADSRQRGAKQDTGICLIDVAYIRVSTERQVSDGYGLVTQTKDIVDWCERNAVRNCILIREEGFTGTVMDRPALNAFVERVGRINREQYEKGREYRIRQLIVPRLDRLGRTLYGTLQFIQDYLMAKDTAKASAVNANRYAIGFVSCKEAMLNISVNQYGVVDPTSMMMLQIFACFAEFDRNQIVTKLKAGRQEHVAAGYPLGGGKKPYGYRYVQDKGVGNYVTVPEEKVRFLEARRLFVEEHMSPAEIAITLGFSTEQLVINMLKRRTYLNRLTFNGTEYEGRFEAFITEEQWQEQQNEFERRAKGRSSSVYVLTSLVYCGNCGAKMRYQKDANGKLRMVCYSQDHSPSKRHLVRDIHCPNRVRYNAEEIERYVFDALFSLSYRNEAAVKKTASCLDPLQPLEQELKKERGALDRLVRLRTEADITPEVDAAYRRRMQECSARIAALEQQKKSVRGLQARMSRCSSAGKMLADLRLTWPEMTNTEKRTVCRELIDRVTVTYTGDKGAPQLDIAFVASVLPETEIEGD